NLDHLGLPAAMKAYAAEFSRRTGIKVACSSSVETELPRPVSLALYRIMQEGLRNVETHSGATKAALELYGSAQTVRLTVRDFGHGMPAESSKGSGHLGITSMEGRIRLVHGLIQVKSDPTGVELVAQVPLGRFQEEKNDGQSKS